MHGLEIIYKLNGQDPSLAYEQGRFKTNKKGKCQDYVPPEFFPEENKDTAPIKN